MTNTQNASVEYFANLYKVALELVETEQYHKIAKEGAHLLWLARSVVDLNIALPEICSPAPSASVRALAYPEK